jgi:hypothetical protein
MVKLDPNISMNTPTGSILFKKPQNLIFNKFNVEG